MKESGKEKQTLKNKYKNRYNSLRNIYRENAEREREEIIILFLLKIFHS